MRFCPFCAQENTDEVSECAHCGRRLPQVAAARAVAAPAPSQPVRPPPVRPLPRPRAVAPAPALPTSGGGPVAASAAPAPENADRGRARTLLGVPSLPPRAAPASEPAADNATRIDPSPFDAPTMQTPRVHPGQLEETTSPTDWVDKEVSETTATAVRVPGLRKAASDEDSTLVRDEEPTRGGDEGPTKVQTTLPPAPRPFPVLGKPSSTPPWGASAAGTPSPAPLPPPPPSGASALVRADPFELATNPGAALPPPAEPDFALPAPLAFEPPTVGRAPDELEPMPGTPAPGLVPAVKYLLPLARAIWARHKAQAALRALLHGDQRLVDDTLHDLGRAAWQEPERPAELRAELARADEDDERRRDEEKEVARLAMSLAAERERFSGDEHERKEAITAREADIARVSADLAERKRAQKTEEKGLREADARYLAAEKRVTQLVAKAARAEVTPPEKGGGAHTAANFRREAEAAQHEADGFRPERDAAMERVRALDAPISELTERLADERAKLDEEQTALEVARRDHKSAIAALEAQSTEHEEARVIAEKSVRLRLVSTGTLISLHRMDSPKLAPIYARLDELQATAGAREARINQLETERHSYDKAALQRGLVVVGAATGIFVILLVIVLVLLAR